MSGYCSATALLLSGDIHVDADGGCGTVCGPGQSIRQEAEVLYCSFHHCQLWYVDSFQNIIMIFIGKGFV